RLGDALVNDGMISEEQLQKALELQKGSGRKLGETLIDAGMVTEENIASVLSKQLGYASIDLQNISISKDVLDLVTPSVLKKNRVLPIEYAPDNMNILRVAMADPLDLDAMDDISIITGCQVEPLVSTPRSVMLAIDRFYGQAEVATALEDYARERLIVEEEDTYSEDINNSPIVVLVKEMIEKAARQRASDIHIEPLEKKVRVRYRIDGALYEKGRYDIRILSAMVARIKIIGGMDISEKRKPQDGRITQIVDRTEYDIRVSILPTVYGEKIVMRLASKNALNREKSQLGLKPAEMQQFDHILKNPHGILLVTGPTGSGKSTTLYTALSELNTEDV
ncbi:MAG: Flp pilus assembly complex ATPase component TadA, partial [Lachnospiraceae bacterium]|nr:Flp pilus assembly complex ATPase component TadA [Lachnospiraceae bacterium]